MPSGHTHDRITWGCFPFITLGGYILTQSWTVAIASGASFLFSGLMFGPDLDIHSKQYRRWGLLRWIWIPYQRYIPHRSWLSHGPIVGTAGRVLYLGGFFGVGLAVFAIARGQAWADYVPALTSDEFWSATYHREMIAGGTGLELGAFSHYASDWVGSKLKRLFR